MQLSIICDSSYSENLYLGRYTFNLKETTDRGRFYFFKQKSQSQLCDQFLRWVTAIRKKNFFFNYYFPVITIYKIQEYIIVEGVGYFSLRGG